MVRGLWLFVSLSLLACHSGSPTSPIDDSGASSKETPTGWEARLSPGETRSFDADRLFVEFRRVEGESRCPTGVQCIWEGDAIAQLTAWVASGEPVELALHTNAKFPASAVVGGYVIELSKIEPYPAEGSRIEPSDYVAVVSIHRG